MIQVLYCNIQVSILNWKIKMDFFFYCLVYKKILSWLNQCNIKWLSSLKLNTMSQFLGCLVKCFYFVWSKMISACQKCIGKGASKAVATWCAVLPAKVSMGTATGWRVVVNGNVKASESRSIRRTVVYWISVRTMLPCLRQFHRCPSWFVHQREKKCLGIISIPRATAYTCWENKKWKRWPMHTISFKNSNSYRQENILITNNSRSSSLAKIDEKCDFNTNFILT